MKKTLFLLFWLLPLLLCAKVRPLVWVLDAGHGGSDQGTAKGVILEKDLTLSVVKELSALLRKNKPGIKLVLTRNDDRTLTPQDRCRIANNANADLFLSVHVNSAPDPFASGKESIYAELRKSNNSIKNGSIVRSSVNKSELLAWLLQKNYGEKEYPKGRGARPRTTKDVRKEIYVLLNTNMPAVLTEVGFLTNINDAATLRSKAGIKQIATDIYNALIEYYTITQGKNEKKSLQALRRTNGKDNGLKTKMEKLMAKNETEKPKNEDKKAKSVENRITALAQPVQTAPKDPTPEEVERMVAQEMSESKGKTEPAKGKTEEPKEVKEKAEASIAKNDAPAEKTGKPETKSEEPVKKDEKPVTKSEEPVTKSEEPADSATVLPSVPAEESVEDAVAAAPIPSIPVFSIQLFAVSKEIKADDVRLKGYQPVTFKRSGNLIKVLYGSNTDYKLIKSTLVTVRKDFPDAFVVAYLGDEPISVADALKRIP